MGDQASVYSRPSAPSIFGEDGKLSSASAATALKYARPQDLPSYPSTGGVHMSSAGAAASLASSNHKSFEHWKPDALPAANKAATLAKDYTMQPLWQPGSTKAGSKAATTAHANPTEVEAMQPKRAATNKQSTPAYDTPENSRSKALMAANSVVNRQRAGSMPTQQPPKPRNDSSWALKAATKSHKDGPSAVSAPFASGDPGFEAARIQNASKDNATRQMYTSAPPVAIEVQEKQRQDMLKASAIAMARKMYAIQQQHIDEASGKTGASKTRNVGDSQSASDELTVSTTGYENLEEAARKLAQERLAKIHDEHAEYRNYYGAQPSPPSRSRLSVRLRRRASENVRDRNDDSDEEQSRRIRSQMSIFQSKLAEVDNKKRQQDRDALLVIAHRNVDAQISKLDEKVFQETGKASPAQMEKWERAAREKAQRDSDERMVNTGKVHIGGGKYIDQSELDAIAKARLQPTLDDIAEKAEKQRARDEEERLEKARKEQQIQMEKTRAAAIAAETRAANQKLKAEEKSRKDTERRGQKEAADVEKQRRRDILAADRERERQEKEEQRKRDQLETFGEQDSTTGDKPEKPNRLATLFSRGSSYKKSTSAAAATTTTTTTTTTAEATEEDADEGSDRSGSEGREVAEGETTFHDLATVTPDVTAETRDPILSEDPKVVETVTAEPPTAERSTSLENRTSMDEEKEEATSPSKSRSRVKSWMRVRFRSKSGSQKESVIMPAVTEQDGGEPTVVKEENEDADAPAKDTSRPESMRDVAMAGRASHESDDLYGPPREVSPPGSKASKGSHPKKSRDRNGSISSLSSHYSEETKDRKSEEAVIEQAKVVEIKPQTSNEPAESDGDQRGRSGFKARLLRKITPNKTASKDDKAMTPVISNATNDEFEEARDTFEEEKSAPLSAAVGENKDGDGADKAISPKASHDRSRFTEDL